MDYICREQFLSFGSVKQTNAQYYQWIEKKRQEKEKLEEQQLNELWIRINQ